MSIRVHGVARVGWLVLAASAAASSLVSQQEVEAVDVPALMRQIRAGQLDDAELDAAADAALATGEPGARSLFHTVRTELNARGKALRKDVARFVRDFGRAAPPVLAARMGREGPKRLEVLREEVLGRSRSSSLTKDEVKAFIDPRVAELRALLTIRPSDVFERVAKLGESHAELTIAALQTERLFDLQERAELVLLRSDTGTREIERYPLADDPRSILVDLERDLSRLCWTAVPMSARDARVLAENEVIQEGVVPEEREGVRILNEIRVLLGLPVVAIDPKLCNASRDHSRDMVEHGFFAHVSPVPGKESFGQRAALAGTSASAENIAAGQQNGAGAIRAWWYSPGHHRNMMGGHRRVGLGQHGSHWTQMFGG
ncbi:MAG: CAP domain-containing protein [Planctomycetota bacterium]|jgi:hypothetical protein